MNFSKPCKQCGRHLSVDNFRKYPARGRGVRATETGYYTICKQCESINTKADYALRKGAEEVIEKLRAHYQLLIDRGLPPVTAAAKRLMGCVDDEAKGSSRQSLDDLLAEVSAETELERHCRLVRTRGYSSVEEAQQAHSRLTAELHAHNYYAEITELLDDWYFDE